MSDDRKREAGRAALELLPESGVVGLGTGSTAKHFIDGVGELVREGRDLQGVPTSRQSRDQAHALGIPLLDDSGPWSIDVCVDGADEVSADLQVIKGGGACHLREKMVNEASRLNVIVVDEGKLSEKLGERWAVPIEVVEFGHLATKQLLEAFGQPTLRERDGSWVRTDSGNLVYDLKVGSIDHPETLERELALIPGVVETGLFVNRVHRVVVAGPDGVRHLSR